MATGNPGGDVTQQSNDQVIVRELLEQKKKDIAPDLSGSDFFELFTSEQVMKDRDLSWDEIRSGVLGGGNDGGIDSAYLFLNGILIAEDTDLSVFTGDIRLEIHLIQAKRTPGFGEGPIQKIRSSLGDLLDLSKNLPGLRATYNEDVITFFERFQDVYRRFSSKLPDLTVQVHYASLGTEVHPNTERQVSPLRDTVHNYFRDAEFDFSFLGARELLEMARRRPRTTYHLRFQESVPGNGGYVCLVTLTDYFDFITNEAGALTNHIFDSNVRDHQGSVQVNRGIRESLAHPEEEDFWWLNNGVTVVATKIVSTGKTLTIENPQIVNGLQTSVEVYNHFRTVDRVEDSRAILVRVIEPEQEESHEKIIRATNSQTSIPVASLKATDRIHRDIEDFLVPRGWYYERRKNYYKNQGKPLEKIITIGHLAQATMAALLGRPNDARARPSSLLKRTEDYEKVFNETYPLGLYLVAATIIKKVENFLRSHSDDLAAKEVNNHRFHMAFVVVRLLVGKNEVRPEDLASLDLNEVDTELLEKAYQMVHAIYVDLGATDQVAKGAGFVSEVSTAVGEVLVTGQWEIPTYE